MYFIIQKDGFIFMQDGALPHFSNYTPSYMNNAIPGRWIVRVEAEDQLCRRSLLPVIFIWGYVKYRVFVPPMPDTLSRSATSNCSSCEFDTWRPADSCVARHEPPFWYLSWNTWCSYLVHKKWNFTLSRSVGIMFLSFIVWKR